MKIVAIKLINGSEIIGKDVSNEADEDFSSKLTLEDPRTVDLVQMGANQYGLQFIPYHLVQAAPHTVSFTRSMLQSDPIYNIGKEFEDKYLENVSGLTLAASLNG